MNSTLTIINQAEWRSPFNAYLIMAISDLALLGKILMVEATLRITICLVHPKLPHGLVVTTQDIS